MFPRLIACLLAAFVSAAAARAEAPDPSRWQAVLAAARGETVYFHAWGGEPRINDYIAWVGREVAARFGVELVHVKVAETGAVVAKVLTEKAAGRTGNGSVDLVWINGENFAAMKENGLLLSEPWADRLPSYRFVDVAGKPTVARDFGVPVDGLEAPWGMARLVFFYDPGEVPAPPRSAEALAAWIEANPGRFTYPQPPDFMGTTFLKQLLVDLAADPAALARPVGSVDFEAVTAPLWAYLDRITPLLWRQGRAYPRDYGGMRQLLADGETAISFAFNPADASSAIANGELPDTVRSFVFDGGTIGNTHFVAIPFDAGASAGAMVVANFLMSPEAQARKEEAAVWGDPTVLAVDRLPPEDRARFAAVERGPATLPPDALGPVLPEPHPSWVAPLEAEWARRYGVGQ
ncbi:ABC transporter substrate-binding protein [Propylenella binzhouense]|uniref:ABC transporter substrate-binding protein n=1 Tax=Propylenella binzhouense TaxID=2555902 RepID=A0A964T7T9_9HYPH|nr:ABC transporter substrate-binding protein [Propylenella binzhouense]MYZ50034.1 ABC transporter substrate-binding protein [Propylenella binzhouense]